MRKWEYLYAWCDLTVVKRQNDREIPSTAIHVYLNDGGQEGWELVSATTGHAGGGDIGQGSSFSTFVLKRPAEHDKS